MLVIILGLLCSASVILASLSTRRGPLLMFSLITNIFAVMQFSTVGAVVAVGTSVIGFARNSTLLLAEKHPDKFSWFNHWGMAPVFIISHIAMFTHVNDWSHSTWINFTPLISSIVAVIALTFQNMIVTKSLLLSTHFMWMGYEIHSQTYGMLIGEVVNVIASTTAIVLIVKSRNTIDTTGAISDALTSAMTTMITIPVTTAIKTVTTTIPVITKKLPTLSMEAASFNLHPNESNNTDNSTEDGTDITEGNNPEELTDDSNQSAEVPTVTGTDFTPSWLNLPSAGPRPLPQLPKAN